jgi:polysaccharide biosynthesis protein PslF
MRALPKPRRIRLAIVSPCPPRTCPVAMYTDELARTLRTVAPEIALSLWAIGPADGATEDTAGAGHPAAGGLPASGVIPIDDPSAYRRAGQSLHRLGAHAALLEYGPGDAGGPHGRHLLGLTDELVRLNVPYLVTLHGVRRAMRPDDADMAAALSRHAAGVIVLSQSARAALVRNRLAAPERVAVVAQGAPPELLRANAADPGPVIARALSNVRDGPLLTTIGHLRPAKGVEVGVTALPLIAARHPGVRYVVAGRTHDGQLRMAGEWYRGALVRAAESIGVADRLILVDADPAPANLSALLHATDVYLATDLDRGRTSAGSLSYALAAERRVVAAANPFAREVVPSRGGMLVPPGDPAAVAAAVDQLLDQPDCGQSRWPSSIAMAEQIAGLVNLITGAPAHRVGALTHTDPAAHRGSVAVTRRRSA